MAKDQLNYVDESTAVSMLFNAYTPKTLRVYTTDPKRKKLPIRTRKIGNKIVYSSTDIQNFILEKPQNKKTA